MVREGRDPIEERAPNKRRALKAKYEDNSTTMLFKDAMPKPTPARKGRIQQRKAPQRLGRSSLDTLRRGRCIGKHGRVPTSHHQDVLRVLNQAVDEAGGTLWETKTDMPQSPPVRGRIESGPWCLVYGQLLSGLSGWTGDNPARWAGATSKNYCPSLPRYRRSRNSPHLPKPTSRSGLPNCASVTAWRRGA